MSLVFEKFFIAADHGGLDLKVKVLSELQDIPWVDLGTKDSQSVDYPDFAKSLTDRITDSSCCGVLICGSGQGMAIRANREKHIRAALCWSKEVTQLARAHNDANVICLGGRTTDHQLALEMIRLFVTTEFEGGRHARRVQKLSC